MKKQVLIFTLFSISFINLKAQIGLGFSTNARIISPYFFGFNGANTIRADSGWAAEPIKNALQYMLPGNMRYPAGTISNFWDWQTGWFFKNLPYNIKAPFDNGLLATPTKCKISDYARSIGGKGPQMVYNLNLMTSNLNYQMAGAAYASSLGLSLAGLEYGNEFYNGFTSNPEHTVPFPTPKAYVDTCKRWAGVMNTWFPGKRVAVVGVDDAGDPADADYTRKLQWLDGLLANVDTTIDAVTLHLYTGSGAGVLQATCAGNSLKKMLIQPLRNRDSLATVFIKIENKGKKMWITEYNLLQKDSKMPGTWAHALFVATQTLTYLERPSFELVDCHDMFGDALSSAYFQDNDGFQNVDPSLSNIVTIPNELTALGTSLTLVSKTLERSSNSEKLRFRGIPASLKFTNSGRSDTLLYGFAFNQGITTGRKQILIMNLSSNTVNIDLDSLNSKLGGSGASIDYEMLQGDPLSYIIGNAETVPLTEVENCGSVTSMPPTSRPNRYMGNKTATDTINLKPYSITYLGGSYGTPEILVDRPIICGNNAQTAIVYGKPPLTLTCSNALVSITPVPATENIFKVIYNGTVATTEFLTATDGNGVTTNKQFIFKIRPTISIGGTRTQSICTFPVSLTSSMISPNSSNPSGWKYIWSDNEGITNPLVKDIALNQKDKEKTYMLQGFDGTCWSQPDSITIKAIGYANAGLDKNVCTSTSITLSSIDAPLFETYEWKNLTTNLVISTNPTATFTTSATPSTTNYQFKMQDRSCIKTDIVKVTTAACCSGGSYVLNPGQTMVDLLLAISIAQPLLLDTIVQDGETYIVMLPSTNTIQFNGDILINKNVKITGYPNLKFAENANLTIENEKYMVLESCTLDVCTAGKFADGIYANSCQTNLTINNCEIKHFKNSQEGNYNAVVTIGNSNFVDNINSITLKNYTLEYPFLSVPVQGDVISGIDNNNFYAPNIIATQNTRGISLLGNEKIVFNNVSSNYFKNLDVGIYNINSSIKLANTIFGGSGPILDTAIYCYSNNSHIPINFIGKKIEIGSILAPNLFGTITYGIVTNGMGVIDIHHNNFNNLTKESAYLLYAQDSVRFNDNIVNTFDKVLSIIDPVNNAKSIEIKGDSVFTAAVDDSQPTYTKTAFTITSSLANNRPVSIFDNYIRCRVGIYASKMNNFTAEFNLIEIPRTYTGNLGYESYGIRLESCLAPKLYINTVRRYNSILWSNRLTGFSLNACANADMQCNKLEYLRRPLYLSGSCLGQMFYNDTINSSGGGLVFSNAAVSNFGGNSLGNGYSGDVFSNFNSSTLRAEGTLSGSINYYYRTGNDAKYKPSPQSVGAFFVPLPTTQIRAACAQAPPKSDDEELLATAALVEEVNDSITDSGTTFDFSAELNFYAQQSLYNQIITDSIDYTEHSDEAELIAEFVTNVSETAIGLENKVVQLLSEGNLDGALAVAAILPDSSVFEKNILFVTEIVLQIASDTLYQISHKDSVALNTLAYTHSLIGGPAVFTARNLLQLVVDEFLDGTTKSQKGKNYFVPATMQNLYLTPNPATEKVSLVGLCDEKLIYKVELYNLQNQSVLTKITGCQSNFAINTLSNGIYLYKIFNNTNLVGYGKIQVLK
jgi:hypothetical protein